MRLKYPKRDRRKRGAISSESAVLEKRKIVERPSYRWPVRRARAKVLQIRANSEIRKLSEKKFESEGG
jgi:hypothetical protein